jgi:hypothetical protein
MRFGESTLNELHNEVLGNRFKVTWVITTLGISFVIDHSIIKIVRIFPSVLVMRFLLEGYNISVLFVVTHWRFRSMPWKNFHNGCIFLPIIQQKTCTFKDH